MYEEMGTSEGETDRGRAERLCMPLYTPQITAHVQTKSEFLQFSCHIND